MKAVCDRNCFDSARACYCIRGRVYDVNPEEDVAKYFNFEDPAAQEIRNKTVMRLAAERAKQLRSDLDKRADETSSRVDEITGELTQIKKDAAKREEAAREELKKLQAENSALKSKKVS